MLFSNQMFSQSDVEFCGTAGLVLPNRSADSLYQDYLEQLNQMMESDTLSRNSQVCDALNWVVIPVAVHFDSGYNCSNLPCLLSSTQKQLESLNDDFAKANNMSKYLDVVSNCGVTNIAGNTCVKFRIANQNHPPESGLQDGEPAITIGQYEVGIEEDYVGEDGAPEWAGYFNIFVKSKLSAYGVSDGVGAQPGNFNGDGVTIAGEAFGAESQSTCDSCGSIDSEPTRLFGRTLTHEADHYLGLDHVFQFGCDQASYISGTQPQEEKTEGCPTINCISTGCSVNEFKQFNFMDYFDDECLVMFTTQQATRIHSVALGVQNMGLLANNVFDTNTNPYNINTLSSCPDNLIVSSDMILSCSSSVPTTSLHIIIESGNTLTIENCIIKFDAFTGIHVSNGATLIIDNSTLTALCKSNLWDGIFVQGDSNSDHQTPILGTDPNTGTPTVSFSNPNNLGVVYVTNNSVIEHSYYGIKNLSGAYSNGMVITDNAKFKNNVNAIDLAGNNNLTHSSITNTDFILDKDYRNANISHNGVSPSVQIRLKDIKDIAVSGCTFTGRSFYSLQSGHALIANDSYFTFENNTIEKFQDGIDAYHALQFNGQTTVRGNTFTHNLRASKFSGYSSNIGTALLIQDNTYNLPV